ncbi:polysaccharide biosynthesis protein [Ectothiorhodospiraceae bacterium BW-2]|nr:polysaccharide biosynthesis protein [Ectothiorhodospiraceae bacterium BW-2]
MGLLVLIITVPMTLGYLGEERFGVWMTFASMAAMLSFLDLGVGNGLISRVAQMSSGQIELLQLTISRGITLLFIIGLVIGLIAASINSYFPLADLIKVESELARSDAEQLAWYFITLFSLSIPLNGIGKVMQGLQRSYWNYFARLAGSIISLFLIFWLSSIEAPPSLLLLATYGVQVILSGSLVLYLYYHNLLTAKLFNSAGTKAEMLHLLNTGGLFLVLQVGTMIGWGADALILSSLAGAVAVTQYTIVQRMFQFVSLPLSIMNSPLWAAYAEAKARGDIRFIKRTLAISFFGTLGLAVIISSLIWSVSGFLLQHWIGTSVDIPDGLILAFAIWAVFEASGTAYAIFLNGIHLVRPQVLAVIIFCVIALPGKIALAPIFGSQSVVFVTIGAYFFSTVIVYIYVHYAIVNNALFLNKA